MSWVFNASFVAQQTQDLRACGEQSYREFQAEFVGVGVPKSTDQTIKHIRINYPNIFFPKICQFIMFVIIIIFSHCC